MDSRIAAELKLRFDPVAVLFTDHRPDGAIQFKEGGRGCVMALFTSAATGKTVAIDRKTVGCLGAVTGLGLGCAYEEMPGGIEYFLSTGRGEGYPEGEGYKKTPELARDLVERFPTTEIACQYVVFTPLSRVDAEGEAPMAVSFYATPDQLSALIVLANYGAPGDENVIAPFASGCAQVCLIPYRESLSDRPRAVLGVTDISARPFVEPDVFAFTVPFAMFQRMEADVPGSFLEKEAWRKVRERIPG